MSTNIYSDQEVLAESEKAAEGILIDMPSNLSPQQEIDFLTNMASVLSCTGRIVEQMVKAKKPPTIN